MHTFLHHLTYLLRNLIVGQEAKLEQDMEQQTGSKSGKEYFKAVYCHLVYLTYVEYIRRNAGLDEAQTGIKIAGRNINNLRYTDDTTFVAKSEKELKSLLMKVKVETEKAGLTSTFKKTKIMTSSPITPWQIDRETMKTVTDYFIGLQNHCRQ